MSRSPRRMASVALAACACACIATVSACSEAVLPRLQVNGVPVPTETLTVVAAPNVFTAASAQATWPSPVDDPNPEDSTASWSISDRNIALVNQFGMVVGRTPGTALVGVQLDRRWSFTAVQVVPPPSRSIEIIAHRGFMRRFPENTTVAVKAAFDNGADAVEVDIRLNADGVPFVMHDATVDRTTDGRGAVNALTTAELGTLNACARWAGYARCAVPLMTDILREAHGRGGVLLHLYGEYTTSDLAKLLTAVRDADMDRETIFICFDYPVLVALRQLDPVVALGFLSYRTPDPKVIDALGRAAPIVELQAAITDSTATRDYVRTASGQKHEVGVWAPLSQAQAQQAVALGFRYLIADVPINRAALIP
ncbi:MAG TPA: glycerophosphodiester phosphodiesterase family protein [Gemmatimonadaceae bacterium]